MKIQSVQNKVDEHRQNWIKGHDTEEVPGAQTKGASRSRRTVRKMERLPEVGTYFMLYHIL
jgi:hypothetical protein